MHLKFDLYKLNEGHPEKIMKKLGIKYKESVPQMMSDRWLFFDCINIPSELPDFISEMSEENARAVLEFYK